MQRWEADICQQVAYVLESIKKEGREVSPQYAFGVLRNTILKFCDKEKSDRRKIESYTRKRASSDCPSPLETLVAKEKIHFLCQVISTLDDEEQLILMFRLDHELTFQTIAKILNYKSDRTISLKYDKIISKLAKRMKIHLDDNRNSH
ncbi:MAG: sigma-70 family RNA polymerase sigma factor [Planctomycetes bacterium]|nr:sigma-70 family RNA polymerase sigma factor [Planctomycetota bacterium]